MLAEQYFSADRCTACSTRLGSSALPVTVKWTWILVKTLGSVSARLAYDVGDAVGDRLARFAQDMHDVKRGAAAQPQQQHFHRPHAEVFAAGFGCAVHDDAVAGFALADEADTFDEFDTGFHGVPSGKNRAEFVPQNAEPFVQGKGAVAQPGGRGQQIEDGVDAGAGKLDAGGDDVETLALEQRGRRGANAMRG